MSIPDTSRIPDRRQRKSRAALQQGLLDLIPSKAYDAITIEDITAAADVARATFYAHYRDKTALLDEAVRDLLQGLVEQVGVLSPSAGASTYRTAGVGAAFRHAEEHRDLYRLVLRGEAGAGARQRIVEAYEAIATEVFTRMVPRRKSPRVPLAATVRAFVGAVLLTLEGWLDEDPRESATGVVTNLLLAQAGGLEWSLGFPVGGLRFEPS